MSEPSSLPLLPVLQFREEIQRTIAQNPVTIISAETGAGKSTQIPLWYFQAGQKVVVTQPRRIAARALSRYLSALTGHRWGEDVGYQTGTDQRKNRSTRLLYVTDGVQMINEIRGRRDYDLLILDEIHEWNLNQEILIGQLRKNLSSRPRVKTVVMSATLSGRQLSRFLGDAPVISIPGRGYPVSRHTHHPAFILSDVVQLLENGQNVLVFQPGKAEISSFCELLRSALQEDKLKAQILPLHSELTISEQARIFQRYPVPKVVVATDVAQTSLTIDDIDAVVDTGVKKEMRLVNGIEGLYPTEISQAECRQREGRAGRTRPGQYILCSERDFPDRPAYPEPEISRLSIDAVMLRMLKWGLDPDRFPFYHPPRQDSIRKAIGRLITFGALNRDLSLSGDGEIMAELPVSLRSARLLVEGLKGSRELLLDTMRLIALIETRGIADTTSLPTKVHPLPLRSDLLNQLFIWKNLKLYRSLVQQKKLLQAQEIFNELKRRIPPPSEETAKPAENARQIMRICLSAFPDHVYEYISQRYCCENEERQLDRQSSLNEAPPAMVTGLPFDLQIRQQDPVTGEEKHLRLSLITMASELSWDLLNELRPFSFRIHSDYGVEGSRIRITRNYFFGGRKLLTREEPPDWRDPRESSVLTDLILDWLDTHLPMDLARRHAVMERAYHSVRKLLKKELPPFSRLIRKQLSQAVRLHLDHDDLSYFFQFHSAARAGSLAELLSPEILGELKGLRWPREHELEWGTLAVAWIRGRPFIQADMESAGKLREQDLLLCSGEKAGVLFNRRRCFSWKQLVKTFNHCQRRRVFEEKWSGQKKPVSAQELKRLEFPLSFIGGRGLEDEAFEYYICPEIDAEQGLVLRHYFSREEALEKYQAGKTEIGKLLRSHEQQSLSDIFKKKGWTVR